MSIKETLQEKRKEYWNSKLQNSIEKITACILTCQEENGFLKDDFIIKLYVSRSEPNGRCNIISADINGQIFDKGNSIEYFIRDESISLYLDKLKDKLEDEEAEIIYINKEFRKNKLKLGEKQHILTAKIVI